MRTFNIPSVTLSKKEIEAAKRNTFRQFPTDRFTVGTLSEFGEMAQSLYVAGGAWMGGMNYQQIKDAAKFGDKPSADMSEKFLKQVEGLVTAPTAKHVIIDDVAGSVPNVPAYLAGQPLSMRRKIRRENENAPIALVMDGTTSGGISAEKMHKRGAAMLALARALSAVRPVELYAMAGLGTNSGAAYCLWQIDTSPMDLMRAAFLCAHPAATRGIMYAHLTKQHKANGSWPHNAMRVRSVEEMTAAVKAALPHVVDVVCAPAIFVNDPMIDDPVGWLKGALMTHLGSGTAE